MRHVSPSTVDRGLRSEYAASQILASNGCSSNGSTPRSGPFGWMSRAEGSGMAHAHTAVEVIRSKRDGGALTDEQIDWVLDAYTNGAVADEQMSALAMAILLRGMSDR